MKLLFNIDNYCMMYLLSPNSTGESWKNYLLVAFLYDESF